MAVTTMNNSYNRLAGVVFAIGVFLTPALAASEMIVERTMIDDMKAVFATVETSDVLIARARIGGTLNGLSVDEGSKVGEGQTIATVVDPKLKLSLGAIDARIESLKSQVKLATTALTRARTLKQRGIIPVQKLDEAETSLDVVSRALKALKADRAVISEQRSEGAVLVPGDGRVIKVHVTNGAVILPGEAIATIAAKGFILRLQLPERHARTIKVGEVISIGSDGKRIGYVSQVYPEMRQGRVVADVAVNDLGDFFVGERVSVSVATGRREAMVVPAEYLFMRFGLMFAMVKGEGEVVVQPGLEVAGGIEVLTGLRVGDVLVQPGTDK
ncbi:MAG: efflux RND transporter periplasmic adaptor subunit [Alphaproteobacteria bacterium]